jgi:uncharacterized cupredoxin-like copper-binding protein
MSKVFQEYRTKMSRPRLVTTVIGFVVAVVLVLTVINFGSVQANFKRVTYRPQTRTYYIAAEKVQWDYAPGGVDQMTGKPVPLPWGAQTKYDKVRYIEYTDATFRTKKPQASWLGILGPVIRGVPGDTIKVVFKNRADKPYSVHPHGVQYTKDNEGSTTEMTADGEASESKPAAMAGMEMPDSDSSKSPMSNMDGEGAEIMPGHQYTYTWHVREDAGPSAGQGSSRVWLYHSHVAAHDIYDGLIGPIVITSAAHARSDGSPDDVDHEFVSLFMIFDESTPQMSDDQHEASLKHTINGRFFDNLPGYVMKQDDRVRWYEMALGNEVDLHTPHWHGNLVSENGQTTDVIELLPASMKTVDMVPDSPGTWAYHCHVVDHMEAGMMAKYTVKPK